MRDNLLNGMYIIMRKLKGYNHFDFMRDDFSSAQYFLLIEFINNEVTAEQKSINKHKSKGRRK